MYSPTGPWTAALTESSGGQPSVLTHRNCHIVRGSALTFHLEITVESQLLKKCRNPFTQGLPVVTLCINDYRTLYNQEVNIGTVHRPDSDVARSTCSRVCVRLVLCSFIIRVDLCGHHRSQNPEQIHHWVARVSLRSH